MKLTIHIGSHKSGSTAIQQGAKLLERELSAAGIFYPYGAFQQYPQQHSELIKLLRPEADEKSLASLFEEIIVSAQKRSHIFLSGEDLCTANDNEIRKLYETAAKRFAEIRIVLVLRNKRDYMISHFNHFLRHSNRPVGIEEFTKNISFSPGKTLDLWRKHFGQNSVLVVPYSVTAGPDLLTRIYRDLFGITPPEKVLADCQSVNASLDLVTTVLFNETFKPRPEFNIGAFTQCYKKFFGANNYRFSFFERDLGDMLAAQYDDYGWPHDERQPAKVHMATESDTYLNSLTNFLISLRDLEIPNKSDSPTTRGFIHDTYRVLLDREPESEAIIQYWLKRTRTAMRNEIIAGGEYKRKNAEFLAGQTS